MKSTNAPDRFVRQTATLAQPKGCRNKIRYPKRKQALGALNSLVADGVPDPERMEVYRCPHGCHGWHVGHRRVP